jgi:ssDNA-binding Zn-finger/Zn-ribbon topoisomerase 1
MTDLPILDESCDCEACVSRTKEMYDLAGQCPNCNARFIVRNRKGDHAPLGVDCPACEVTVYGWRAFSWVPA